MYNQWPPGTLFEMISLPLHVTLSLISLHLWSCSLKLVEDNLNEIALAQGQNVTELVNLVQENEGILKQMKVRVLLLLL